MLLAQPRLLYTRPGTQQRRSHPPPPPPPRGFVIQGGARGGWGSRKEGGSGARRGDLGPWKKGALGWEVRGLLGLGAAGGHGVEVSRGDCPALGLGSRGEVRATPPFRLRFADSL